MALSRTWYTDANVAISDFSSALRVAQSILWGLKALLKGEVSGTNGPDGAPPVGSRWTCEGSSDSATAGMDAVDRWGATFDNTKLVRNTSGSAHSWIVLKSPAALAPLYMLIDWSTGSDATVTLRFSYNAFTGGSATTAPTSTGSWAHSPDGSSSVSLSFTDGSSNNHNLHRVTDANGNFWFTSSKNASGLFHWLVGVQTLSETRTGETKPVISLVHQGFGGRGAGAQGARNPQGFFNAGGSRSGANTNPLVIGGRLYDNSAQMIGGPLTIGYGVYPAADFGMQGDTGGTEAWRAAENAIDSKWDFFPCWVYDVNSTKGGTRGRIPDLSTVVNGVTIGAGAPSVASQERCVVGDLVIPFSVAPSL